MFEKAENRFRYLKQIAKNNNCQLDIIERAYQTALDLHKNQKRQDGTPYINHPVEVALILAKLGFDEEVIAGALLHDTIEDCGYTKEEMIADFGQKVFDLVDCVSAIDKTKYVFDKKNLFEDPNFLKSSLEEQTFKKLIILGKSNPLGFAIKFADRLHNLSTIEVFNYNKQLEKVRETEKWVLPIARALQSEYFYRAIKNECFKIVNRGKCDEYISQYQFYHFANEKNIAKLDLKLKELFASTPITKVRIKDVREYKVYEDICKIYKHVDIGKVYQGQIMQVSNYNIYLTFKNITHKRAIGEVLKVFDKTFLKIIDMKIGSFTKRAYFQVEDNIKNKYNLYIMSENDYHVLKVGTLDGQNLDLIDEENINQLDIEQIKVKTRSGEIKYIAKDSTALDFAFKIHRDVGFGFKYALINDSKTFFPPYTKLHSDDKVEIIVDRDKNGNIKNNATLRWFAYVNTEQARRVLIRYFEQIFKK